MNATTAGRATASAGRSDRRSSPLLSLVKGVIGPPDVETRRRGPSPDRIVEERPLQRARFRRRDADVITGFPLVFEGPLRSHPCSGGAQAVLTAKQTPSPSRRNED